MPAPVRGRDQSLLCPTSWSVASANARGVAVSSRVHSCGRTNGHAGQHVCRWCSARKNNP